MIAALAESWPAAAFVKDGRRSTGRVLPDFATTLDRGCGHDARLHHYCRDVAHLGDDVPGRKIRYEDLELSFCILDHVDHGARESKPHDHGPGWAIRGQAQGKTTISDWVLVEPASADKPGRGRPVRKYSPTRGMPDVDNEGDRHSPHRNGSTRANPGRG